MHRPENDLDLSGKRLLLIKPSSLGDVVQGVATAWALKERWPGLHLSWLVNSALEPLLEPIACIDQTIPFQRDRFRGVSRVFSGRSDLSGFVRRLRAEKFDVVLDLQGLFRSGLFGWLSRAPLRVGQRGARELAWIFYNRRIRSPRQPVHARERYQVMASALDCAEPRRQDLDVRDDERAAVWALLAEHGIEETDSIVAVCPGARWETKIYPASRFAEALDRLAEQAGAKRPVLTGSPDMASLCDEVKRHCRVARPVDLCGKTNLRQLAALLDVASVLLTCDSGPMHMAAAQGTPVVAVLGPTDPRRTGPFGQLENVISGECELMPCLKRRCPGLGNKCMRDLEGSTVAERAIKLLRSPQPVAGQGE